MHDQIGGSQPFDQCWVVRRVGAVAKHAVAGADAKGKCRNTVNRLPAFDGKRPALDRLRWNESMSSK